MKPIEGGFKCLKLDVECGLVPVHSNLKASWVLGFNFLCEVFFLFLCLGFPKDGSCVLIRLS